MSESDMIRLERRLEQLRQQVEAQEAQDRLRLAQDVSPGALPAEASDSAGLRSAVDVPTAQPGEADPSQITRHPKRGIEFLQDVEKEALEPPRMREGQHRGGPERGG